MKFRITSNAFFSPNWITPVYWRTICLPLSVIQIHFGLFDFNIINITVFSLFSEMFDFWRSFLCVLLLLRAGLTASALNICNIPGIALKKIQHQIKFPFIYYLYIMRFFGFSNIPLPPALFGWNSEHATLAGQELRHGHGTGPHQSSHIYIIDLQNTPAFLTEP